MDRLRDPFLSIVLVIVVGAVCGTLVEAALARAGKVRPGELISYVLIGVAGAFLGFHAAMLSGLGIMQPIVPFLVTAMGAGLVLLGWQMTRR